MAGMWMVFWLWMSGSAQACESVAACEAACEAGDADGCASLSAYAWANPWGLGLQADRLLAPGIYQLLKVVGLI